MKENKLAGYEHIFFDMDGTILFSEKVSLEAILNAFEDVYSSHGIKKPLPSRELVLSQIGKPDETFFIDILPKEIYHLQPEIRKRTTDNELKYYEQGRGGLFEGTEETLGELKKRGYRLALISNCGKRYFDAVKKIFKLDRFFERFLCIEETDFHFKHEMVGMVYNEYGRPGFVMVGDRHYDLDAAEKHGMPSVACLYGYGSAKELSGATVKIDKVSGLLDVFTGR